MPVQFIFDGKYNNTPLTTAEKTLAQARKDYRKKLQDLSALETPMKKASIYLDRWVQSNFKTEGGKVGGWQEFKLKGRMVYKGRKGRRKGTLDTSAKLLQDTGRLRASFFPGASKEHAWISSDLDYAETHQKGSKTRRIPARRMLPKQSEIVDDINKILKGHIVKSMKLRG